MMRKFIFFSQLFLLTLLSSISLEVQAGACDVCCDYLEETKEPIDYDFDACTGELSFLVKTIGQAGADVVTVNNYNIEYSYNGTSNWIKLVDFNRFPLSGGNPDTIAGNFFYLGELRSGTAPTVIFHRTYGTDVTLAKRNAVNAFGDPADWGGALVKWNVPAIALANGGLELRVARGSAGVGPVSGCGSSYSAPLGSEDVFGISSEIPTFQAPSGLTATNQTVCNKIDLTWTDPNDGPSCTPNLTKEIQIQRKLNSASTWTNYAVVNFGVVTYSNTVTNNNQYDYRVIAKYTMQNNRVLISSPSTKATGQRKTLPPPATNLTATNNTCDGTIVLDWDFVIQADDYTVTWGSSGNALGITNNTYTISGVPRGQNISIVVKSNNICGLGTGVSATGSSIADPTPATNIAIAQNGTNLNITWTDGSGEDSYDLVRTNTNGSSTNIITTALAANTTSYIDSDVSACTNYSYKLVSKNPCTISGPTINSSTASFTVNTDISNTFSSSGLTASKGTYTNKVQLNYSVVSNASLIQAYNIYRRNLLGSGGFALLYTLNGSTSTIYNDLSADANVLYEYGVVGSVLCDSNTIYTDTIKSVGFKSASGVINGKVSYIGATQIAVEGAKVSVTPALSASGSSLDFSSGSKAQNLNPTFDNQNLSEFTAESWVKLDVAPSPGTWAAMSDCDGGSFVLGGDALNIFFSVKNINNFTTIAFAPISYINIGEYNHFAGVYNGNAGNAKIYINGNLVAEANSSTTLDSIMPTSICLGDGLDGKLDESKLFNYAKDSLEILQSFDLKANNTEAGLMGAWNFDENGGNFVYDKSKQGSNFNQNHCEILNTSYSWSSDIPSVNQLGIGAYTNSNGDYNIVVPYSGIGENFIVSPFLGTHLFNPGSQVLFIGDGATIQNNINFEDISAFQMTGRVSYDSTTCLVSGANIKIDGVVVTSNNAPIVTDALGMFDIQVPIGDHVVTVEKSGHTFSEGRFPPTGTFDFQAPVLLAQFKDATLRKVVGRVIGGEREAIKIPGLGRSVNNIGTAELIFESLDGCYTTTVYTDSATGEYEVYLPPLNYLPPTINIPSSPEADFYFDNQVLSGLNLSGNLIEETKYDTIYDLSDTTNSTIFGIDSIKYHKNVNYVYKVLPKIIVKDRDGVSDFIGDTVYTYIDASGTEVERNLKTNPLRWPLFTQKDDGYLYRCMIKVFEEYSNSEPGYNYSDSVPTTTGIIQLTNQLSKSSIVEDANGNLFNLQNPSVAMNKINSLEELKWLVYSFEPGDPNLLTATIPDYNFTNTFEINITFPDNSGISWQPIGNGELLNYPKPSDPAADELYRGILLGSKSAGGQFFTEGPDIPEYVLRDPPGSGSSATREVGSTKTEENSWSYNSSFGGSLENGILVGAKFSVGVGVSTATDVKQNLIAGFETEISGGREGSQSLVTTNTDEWSTFDGDGRVGADSDLFIGKSKNVSFSIADVLTIVDTAECSSLDCVGAAIGGVSLAKKNLLAIVPEGYATQFIYSADHIKNYLIPDLEQVRNALIQTSSNYTSILPISDPNYGKNNDDEVFGIVFPGSVYNGASYIFSDTVATTVTDVIYDSVRYVNKQIKHWEDALRLNEWEKANIDNPIVLDSLKNYELNKLDTKNTALIASAIASGIAAGAGATASYALSVSGIPGAAFIGYATFAVTTLGSIANAELQNAYTAYVLERQKIIDRYQQSHNNYSISGGSSFTSSMTHETATSNTTTLEYSMSASLKAEISATVSNTGLSLESSINLGFESGRNWTQETTASESVSFTLNDPDIGDFMSVDVYPSLLGWGPIFKLQPGGATSCPYEDETVSEYYNPGTVLSGATLQREKPTISVAPSILYNVPTSNSAVFNLSIGNDSESGEVIEYGVSVVNSSNPNGAIVRINGLSGISLVLNPGTATNQVLTIQKGAGPVYNYDSILVVVHSSCQYAGGGSSDWDDIVDSVYVSAHFLPTCTDVELATPLDNWVLNNSYNDTLPLLATGYDINFFDFTNFNFEYKKSSNPNWIGIESYYTDTTGSPLNLPIPTNSPFTSYKWDVSQLQDGEYDLRLRSECSLAEKISPIYSGVIDRINPHPFGLPSPADGILDPNDDISIRFNEPLDLGSITPFNFDIRGVLNQTTLAHYSSLYFDGVNDEVNVQGGVNIQNRDFTIEFWAKRDALGEQVIFSQGASPLENLSIGFDASNRFAFKIGNTEVTSSNTITNTNWHHYAVAYDFNNETLELFIDGTLVNNGNINFFTNFVNTDALVIGKNASTNSNFFSGNLYEVRVWNKYQPLTTIVSNMNINLSKSALGLLYNWRMDEATGILAKDHVRSRDGIINGPIWQILPSGSAVSLDGVDDYIEISNAGNVAITDEMDFTLEFWFNSSATGASTLFSNGTGTNLASDSLTSWSIEKDVAGQIHILHNGIDFIATNNDYFDGEWHHFAMVFQRAGNLTTYIDGNLQNSTQALNFEQFGGPKMYLGAKGYFIGSTDTVIEFTAGMFDEFRFWNTARKVEQVARDKQNRLIGNELGLKVYLPFEEYAQVLGVPVLTPSFVDVADPSHVILAQNGANLVNTSPTIKLQRPIQSVNFTYSLNSDEIIITPTTSSELIENVTLDITVENIKDLNGNFMQSPKTWIAYMDKNQVIWQDELLTYNKNFGDVLTFTSAVVNNGGATKTYNITNLPAWLTASQTSGAIPPNSVQQITFTIVPNVNIGDYIEDIYLTTDFGFDERLTLDLKVRAEEPAWNITPANYTNSMSIIGYIEINDVVSTSEEDILAVFVNDTCRGAAHLEYVPQLDRYLVFLDVYSNLNNGENLEFKVWDASSGTIFSEILPSNLTFASNSLVGAFATPQLFETSYEIEVAIPLNTGWNWVSHFLMNPDSLNLDLTLESLESVTGDEIKGISNFSNYLDTTGWVGALNPTGIKPEDGYKLKVSQVDTLIITGDIIDPTSRIIEIDSGWNWIGFISIRNQSVTQALGNLNPTNGDIVKAQSQFAVYDNTLGWLGSLQTMKPGTGYMYYTTVANSFVYPEIGQYKFGVVNENAIYKNKKWTVQNNTFASNMTVISSLDTDCDYILDNASDIVVGVFDEDANCRAVNTIELLEDDIYSFLTVGGANTTKIKFGIMDTKTGRAFDLTEEASFSSNQRLGTINEPLMLKVSDEICFKMQFEKTSKEDEIASSILGKETMQVYPTIFENNIDLYYLGKDEGGKASVKLYNLWGQLIFTEVYQAEKGYNKMRFDLAKKELPTGVYHFIVEDENAKMHSFKIVKK